MSTIVPLHSAARNLGVVPQTIDDVFRLAKAISLSGLAPRGMDKPEQVTVAILHGMEIGLPPMQAVQRIAVINGRPTVWGDAIPAIILSRGFKMREWFTGDGDDTVAHCEITRPDGDKIERTFSQLEAKKAGLLGKTGPWQQYTRRMLQMRARGFAARDGAPDALSGLYITEELQDVQQMKDVTPAQATVAALPDIPDIPDEAPPTDTEEAREAIKGALNIEMLEHVREAYADADWSQLEADYDVKHDELHAVTS